MLSPLALKIRLSLATLASVLCVYGFFFTPKNDTTFFFYGALCGLPVLFDIDRMIAGDK